MEIKKSTQTNQGFWTIFWSALVIMIVLAFLAFTIQDILPRIIMILVIIGIIAYCNNNLKIAKGNQFGIYLWFGKFSNEHFESGPVHTPLGKFATSVISYKTGTFLVPVPFNEVNMENLDQAEGVVTYTFKINPEDSAALYSLTRGEMNHDKLIEEIVHRLETTTSQGLGSATKTLDITSGRQFEEETKGDNLCNYLGEYLTRVKADDYKRGLAHSLLVSAIALHLTRVEIGDIKITGNAYETQKLIEQEEEKKNLAKAKAETLKETQKQFNVMLDENIQAYINTKKKNVAGTHDKISEEELTMIIEQTTKTYRQQSGAEVIVFEGINSSGINQKEFISRIASEVIRRKKL